MPGDRGLVLLERWAGPELERALLRRVYKVRVLNFALRALRIQRLSRDYNDKGLTVKSLSLEKYVFIFSEQYKPFEKDIN